MQLLWGFITSTVFNLHAAKGRDTRDCDSNPRRWEEAFLLASSSQILLVQQQHSAGRPWHNKQQGHDNPVPAATGSSIGCDSPSRGKRLCFTDLLQEFRVFRNSNKSSCDSKSQFKMWQWTQVEKEEFRTTLFFSYFEDKLVESRDSWKTEKETSLNNGALITPKVEILVCFRISLHCWVRSVGKYLPLNILK